MAQWLSFTIVAAILTLVLLVLTRRSQKLLDATVSQGHDRSDAPRVQPRGVQTATDGKSRGGREELPRHQESAPTDSTLPTQNGELEVTSTALFANVAVTQGLVAAIIVAAGWHFGVPVDAFGVTAETARTGLQAVVLGTVFGIALWLGNEFSTTVADAVGASYDEGVRELLAPDSPGGWLVLFAAVLPVIAVGEEVLFRAALIGVPATGFDVSPWALALVSSLAFALGHGAQGRVGIVVTGLLGFVLAAGYIVTGSLLLVIVAHYVVNASEFFTHEYLGVDELFSELSRTLGR